MQIQKQSLSHRKTVSNKDSETQNSYLTSKTFTKKQVKNKQLIKKLASLQILKNMVVQNKTQDISMTKRIRTEGDNKYSFNKNNKSSSPNKQNKDLKPKIAIIKNILNLPSFSDVKRKVQRNQSADFQQLIQPTHINKKYQSHGSLNDFFMKTLRRPQSQKFLTTQQFKEKLYNFKQTSERKQQRKQSNMDIISTQKKQDNHQRIRTETSQQSGPQSRMSFVQDDAPTDLENKIDTLVQEVCQLKKKSEQLELQNKILFENLTKIQKEQSSPDRNQLLVKLDQMISMQQRQEDNLNYFKKLFQQSQARRIKTDQDTKIHPTRPLVRSAYQGLEM